MSKTLTIRLSEDQSDMIEQLKDRTDTATASKVVINCIEAAFNESEGQIEDLSLLSNEELIEKYAQLVVSHSNLVFNYEAAVNDLLRHKLSKH